MSNIWHDLLIQLVSIPSESCQEEQAVRYLVDWMSEHGFRAFVDEVGNAVGMRGKSDAPYTLMLLGHIDTVGGFFPVRLEDGRLFGRGSVDAKGSLCSFVAAVAQAQIPNDWRVIVVGAVQEEVSSSAGAHFVRAHYCPDLCVIGEPSGATRLTLGYKGRLIMEYELRAPHFHTAHQAKNAPELGVEDLLTIQQWVEDFNTNVRREFDRLQVRLQAIASSSDGIDDLLAMTIGFRLPLSITSATLFEKMSALVNPAAKLICVGQEEAYLSDKHNALVRLFSTGIRTLGERPAFVLKSGTSDMNVVGQVWKCPIVAYGPGDSSLDHTPNEHLPLAEYDQAIHVLKYLIEHL
ncbi:MAG: acetyl-lysine deacetylase [Phototrophicales bacterium]|nr:MAG: acetyl-lysine deacetylase [Phototrophicales bacterium]